MFDLRAGGVANEVIAGVRTVASLTAEEHEVERYSHHLEGAEKAGIMAGELAFTRYLCPKNLLPIVFAPTHAVICVRMSKHSPKKNFLIFFL